MSVDRRHFLLGATASAAVLALTACVGEPSPSPTTTVPSPVPEGSVPLPSNFVRSNWTTDPFSLGGSSYVPTGSAPESREALGRSVADRVFFAGEATSPQFPGTLNGAQSSGTRAAAEIVATAADGERIGIVGAGIAGAAAARDLVAAGYEVLVFEGRDRVGGRADAQGPGQWPFLLDLGPSIVHGVDSSTLTSQLRALDVQTVSLASSSVVGHSMSGEVVPGNSTGADALAAAVEWGSTQLRDVSLSTALAGSGRDATNATPNEIGVSPVSLVAAYVERELTTQQGADPDQLSAWYGVDDSGTGEGGDAFIVGSTQAIIVAGLDGADVVLSTPVREIAYDADNVRLKMATGESITLDRVIVTVPLGVLQSDSIEFVPPLPFAHRSAVAALGMGAIEKVWLRYDEPFWSEGAVFWSVVSQTDPFTTAPTPLDSITPELDPAGEEPPLITQWINLVPVTGDAVLVGLVGGRAARALSKLSDDEVRDVALRSLLPFLPAG